MRSTFSAVTHCSILPSRRRILRVFQVPVTQLSFGVTQPFDVQLTREQSSNWEGIKLEMIPAISLTKCLGVVLEIKLSL